MTAKSDWPKSFPQSRPSLIQKYEGKEKSNSEKNPGLSYSLTSDSTSSSSTTSRQASWNRNDRSSSKVSSPMFTSTKWSYGSIQGLNCADRQSIASLFDADDYTPPTPPHTTISHDENDEGIYLSWTQHMLKSSKISPSAVDDSDSDTDSTNSSLTDDEESSPSMPITPPYLPLERPYSDPESPVDTDTKETKSWLMMPFCGLCLI